MIYSDEIEVRILVDNLKVNKVKKSFIFFYIILEVTTKSSFYALIIEFSVLFVRLLQFLLKKVLKFFKICFYMGLPFLIAVFQY